VELVQTEEAFVTDLEKLINQYILPANLSFLEATEKLQKTHAGFLSSLRDAAGDLLMPSNAFAPLNYAQIKARQFVELLRLFYHTRWRCYSCVKTFHIKIFDCRPRSMGYKSQSSAQKSLIIYKFWFFSGCCDENFGSLYQ
jgi:hypothetical protein